MDTDNENFILVAVDYPKDCSAELILAPRDEFYKYARNDSLFRSVDEDAIIEGPLKIWFPDNYSHKQRSILEPRFKFRPSRVSIDNLSIRFPNGRHRAKWLIQERQAEIPVLMDKTSMHAATEMGLVSKIITGRMNIYVPKFDYVITNEGERELWPISDADK